MIAQSIALCGPRRVKSDLADCLANSFRRIDVGGLAHAKPDLFCRRTVNRGIRMPVVGKIGLGLSQDFEDCRPIRIRKVLEVFASIFSTDDFPDPLENKQFGLTGQFIERARVDQITAGKFEKTPFEVKISQRSPF